MANNSPAFTPASLRKNRNSGARIQPPADDTTTSAEDVEEKPVITDAHIEPTPTEPEVVEAQAPKIETPKVAAVPVAPVAKVTPVDPTTAQLNECLAAYKKLLSGNRISNAQSAQAMAYLKKATDILIQNPIISNLSAMWTFQQQNKNGVCSEKVALTGINLLDPKSKNIVSVVYNAFRSRVMNYSAQMRDSEILSVVPCQRLVQFLKTAR